MSPSPVRDRWYHALSGTSSLGTSSSSHVIVSPQEPERGAVGVSGFAAHNSAGLPSPKAAGLAKLRAREHASRRLMVFLLFFIGSPFFLGIVLKGL